MNHLTPVENYTPPKIPTLANKPPLRELPKRWAKNAAVVACIGMLGASALAGCASGDFLHHGGAPQVPYYVARPTEQELPALHPHAQLNYSDLDINVRVHGGGSGSAFYVVHLTEQEMQGIILAQLEAAGLNFNATPPSYAINDEENSWSPRLGLDLFDAQRNAAVSFITWEQNNRPFGAHGGSSLARSSARNFAELTDMPVGVFYNPGESVGGGISRFSDTFELIAPTDDEIAMALPILVARLHAQGNNFLYQLGEQPAVDELDVILQAEAMWNNPEEISQYNIQLSRPQAWAIIRGALQAQGLDLDRTDIALELNDEGWGLEIHEEDGVIVGVFGNRRRNIADLWFDGTTHQPPATPSQQQAANYAPILQAHLVRQAQTFITHLQAEGIL